MEQRVELEFDGRIRRCLQLTFLFLQQLHIEALICGVRRHLPSVVVVIVEDPDQQHGALEFLFPKDSSELEQPRFMIFYDAGTPGGKPFHIIEFEQSAQPVWFIPSQMLDEQGFAFTSDSNLKQLIQQFLETLSSTDTVDPN